MLTLLDFSQGNNSLQIPWKFLVSFSCHVARCHLVPCSNDAPPRNSAVTRTSEGNGEAGGVRTIRVVATRNPARQETVSCFDLSANFNRSPSWTTSFLVNHLSNGAGQAFESGCAVVAHGLFQPSRSVAPSLGLTHRETFLKSDQQINFQFHKGLYVTLVAPGRRGDGKRRRVRRRTRHCKRRREPRFHRVF